MSRQDERIRREREADEQAAQILADAVGLALAHVCPPHTWAWTPRPRGGVTVACTVCGAPG